MRLDVLGAKFSPTSRRRGVGVSQLGFALMFVVGLELSAPVSAQENVSRASAFSSEAIARAVAASGPTQAQAQNPSNDWSRLATYVNEEVIIEVEGLGRKTGRLLAVDQQAITISSTQSSAHRSDVMSRDRVLSVSRPSGRRGSVVGAIVGGALGLGLGVAVTVKVINAQCFAGCTGNYLVSGAALGGLPLGGGVLGYRMGGDRRTLTLLYVKP